MLVIFSPQMSVVGQPPDSVGIGHRCLREYASSKSSGTCKAFSAARSSESVEGVFRTDTA